MIHFSTIHRETISSASKPSTIKKGRSISDDSNIFLIRFINKISFCWRFQSFQNLFLSSRWHDIIEKHLPPYFPAWQWMIYFMAVDAEMIQHLPWISRFRFFFIFFVFCDAFFSNFSVLSRWACHKRVSNIKVHKKNYVNKNLSQFDKQRDAMKKRTFPKFRLAFCW